MTDVITTSLTVAAKVEALTEGLAKAAESENPVSFPQGLADLVRLLTAENQRLNEVLRNEIAVPPRRAISVTAAEYRDPGASVCNRTALLALDCMGDTWLHLLGDRFWQRLPSIPAPAEAERQAREREEEALRRHRIAQERAFR